MSVLKGMAREEDAIQHTGVPRFDVMLAGEPCPVFDTEVLADGLFSACIERCRKDYDFVILDSPPVLPVADARILAGRVDGTVMVLRSSHCRRTGVVQAYADLSAAGGRLLGTVLVGTRVPSGYGYYADYRYSSESMPSLQA
jgi:Mrp family chromosome partitioning ATPase